ncbi:MAG: ATP-binding cassette domain-containing protein [Eubacteriales bacterium]|nr:ATP-binding cassette domain-containing protein [Eubacteriales bacterium]
MLEAVHLSKSFDGKPIIVDFSQRLETGVHYCLMGPSGCGKTTLLRLLMGLLQPDAGEVRGSSKMSAVFQENRLLEPFNAIANVELATGASRGEIERLLMELGLEKESLFQPVSAFSGGMKRRVALARALLAEYDALFLDEPFKGLDDETKARVMRIVSERTKGKTVLLVTHDETETLGFQPISL